MSRLREARKAAKDGLGFEDLQVKFRMTEKQAYRIVFGHNRHDPRPPAHHKEGQALIGRAPGGQLQEAPRAHSKAAVLRDREAWAE